MGLTKYAVRGTKGIDEVRGTQYERIDEVRGTKYEGIGEVQSLHDFASRTHQFRVLCWPLVSLSSVVHASAARRFLTVS